MEFINRIFRNNIIEEPEEELQDNRLSVNEEEDFSEPSQNST